MNYVITAIMCLVALVVGFISLLENELIAPERKKWFLILAPIIVIEVVLDTIGFVIDGEKTMCINFYRVIKMTEFIIAPVIPALFAIIIARQVFWEKIKIIYYLLVIFNFFLQILNLILPFLFVINTDAEYKRTAFSSIYLIDLGICVVLLIISSINAFIQNTTISFTLICSVGLIVGGVIFRMLFEKCNSDWIAITFSYFIFIIVYCNGVLKVDPVTSLLNRRVYDNKVRSINYCTAIIMIDANDFKKINDTYGHDIGDWALARISEAIQEVYGKIGNCYRYGGDEFAVILKAGILKKPQYQRKLQDKYKYLEGLSKQLDKKILQIGKNVENVELQTALQNGISQGWGITNGSDFEIAFKKAEERMYEQKQAKKI